MKLLFKMNLCLILCATLTSSITKAQINSDDLILMKDEPAPFSGVLVPGPNYIDFLEAKKNINSCHDALGECSKSIEFPISVAPVRDGILWGVGGTIALTTLICVFAHCSIGR